LTAHTPGWDGARLFDGLEQVAGRRVARLEAGDLRLDARSGAALALGAFARLELAA
jgi:hypothetical protein